MASTDILSQVTIFGKYAKYIPELKRRETWEEIVYRNMSMHVKKYPTLENEIIEAYQYVLDKKVLPSMRSMQFGGTPIELNPTRSYNCSYSAIDSIYSFDEAMFLLLSGCGYGYSVQLHHIEKLPPLQGPNNNRNKRYLIGDSIEGWSSAIRVLVESYFHGKSRINFDYRDIRQKGAALVTSGGKAPGPQPLKDCIHNIEKVLDNALTERGSGTQLKSIEAHDIICYIADAVLSGGIRRAACISLFSFEDTEMLSCKSDKWYETDPQRARANNSVVLVRRKLKKHDFDYIWEHVKASGAGEPGIFLTNDKDMGTNPCAEISLKSNSFCNLTSINVSNIESEEDLHARCKAAAFIGTLQASYTDFHYLRDIWKRNTEKEALLGVSMTGIGSGEILKYDLETAAKVVVDENKRVAEIIGINSAARVTTIKPEGCQKKETMVSTIDGILSLEEIGDINGDIWQDTSIKIHTDIGTSTTDKFYINGIKDTKKILLDSGIELEATHNHMYRVITENGNYIWKRSDEIVDGDMLPYSLGEYSGNNYQQLNQMIKPKTSCREISQPTILDEDFAWFLGLYFGDGSNHDKGIRIHFNKFELKGFDRLVSIINSKFNLSTTLIDHSHNDGRTSAYINSTMLLRFLSLNNILKNKSIDLEIPKIIRMSPKSVIASFIDGYATADGCDKGNYRSFVTISSKMAEQLVVVLRAIGIDCKLRLMPPTDSSFGTNMRYWIQERKGRSADQNRLDKHKRDIFEKLNSLGLSNLSFDTVVSVSDGRCATFDISVPDGRNSFIANSYISHNTLSLVCGTSSGIHAWHAPFYLRRLRLGKNEALYQYLKDIVPELLEDEFFKPETQSILTVPIKAPQGSIFRTESEVDLLERVKLFHNGWIKPGHNKGSNTHNVSVTVSVTDWDAVGNWMWENKNSYNGISVLPTDNNTYVQLPFEDCTEEEYNRLAQFCKQIDLTQVLEENNNVNFKEVVACGGAGCSVNSV